MFLNPSILALVLVSTIVVLLMLLATVFAIQILRHWDIQSGSEYQLKLERRTYLIATLLVFCFLAETVSLLLFVYNAEQMSGRFVGAMCATGVLNLNQWGWPTLFLKILLFFAGAAWLMLNRLDNMARDYPLVKVKYTLFLALLPVAMVEAVVQVNFFAEMEPDVITSCCGALFSPEGEGVAAEVSSLAPGTSLSMLTAVFLAGLLSGLYVLIRKRGYLVFSLVQITAFFISLAAIVSFIALYVYEHPHHHCPFCLLKSGHGYIGYLLYIPLFIATAFAVGTGFISLLRAPVNLQSIMQRENQRYVSWVMILMLVFYLVSTWAVVNSNLTMTGVWW